MIKLIVLAACVFFVIQRLTKSLQTHSPKRDAPPQHKDPFQILGIDKHASKEEIKKAYRQQLSQNHPDKVAHLSKELQQTARQKTQEIQWAFEKLQ